MKSIQRFNFALRSVRHAIRRHGNAASPPTNERQHIGSWKQGPQLDQPASDPRQVLQQLREQAGIQSLYPHVEARQQCQKPLRKGHRISATGHNEHTEA